MKKNVSILWLILVSVIWVTACSSGGGSNGTLGTVFRISVSTAGQQADDRSFLPFLSAEGRFVAFGSSAANLVTGDTNSVNDVFMRDRQISDTAMVSVDSSGLQANGVSYISGLSSDGRYVVYNSTASNLVSGDTNSTWDVFVHDRQTGVTERVSIDSSGVGGNGNSSGSKLSADGRYVVFYSVADNLISSDTNSTYDVFVHDRQSGTTERVSESGWGW